MADVGAGGNVAGGLGPDENPGWIALSGGDVLIDPLDGHADGFGGIVPSLAGMALHVDADHTVFHGPIHDVVVERVAIGATLLLIARAPRYVEQDGALAAALVGGENVEHIFGIGAERDVAGDGDTGGGRFGLEGRVEVRGF